MDIEQSWFPVLIRYTESGEVVIVESPDDILPGATFVVLKTRTE